MGKFLARFGFPNRANAILKPVITGEGTVGGAVERGGGRAARGTPRPHNKSTMEPVKRVTETAVS